MKIEDKIKLLTRPYDCYLSEKAKEYVRALTQAGFDPDLAHSMTESLLPESETWEIPE